MATLPILKCIRVVAGTPAMELPIAVVASRRFPTRTLKMTAFRSCSRFARRAMATTLRADAALVARACVVLADALGP
jgi:hypothetical protein